MAQYKVRPFCTANVNGINYPEGTVVEVDGPVDTGVLEPVKKETQEPAKRGKEKE